MSWATWIPVIIQYGLPVAQKLWEKATSGKDPTAEDWAELTTMSKDTAQSRTVIVLLQNGIDPTSDKGKAILALAA